MGGSVGLRDCVTATSFTQHPCIFALIYPPVDLVFSIVRGILVIAGAKSRAGIGKDILFRRFHFRSVFRRVNANFDFLSTEKASMCIWLKSRNREDEGFNKYKKRLLYV